MLIILFCLFWTILLSSIAGYFSVIGFATLFSGSPIAVMIMAGALESAKLIIVTVLHKYWKEAGFIIRTILILPFIMLVLITMGGIFGYLSKAHLTQTIPVAQLSIEMNAIDSQIQLNQTQSKRYQSQLDVMDKIIDQQIEAGNPNRASNTRDAQRRERDNIKKSLDQEFTELGTLQKKKFELDQQINTASIELGPLKAVSQFLGIQADNTTISWFIMLLAPVFDMVSMSLLIMSQKIFNLRQLEKARVKSEIKIEPTPTRDAYFPTELRDDIIGTPSIPEIEARIRADLKESIYKEQKQNEDLKIKIEDKEAPGEMNVTDIKEIYKAYRLLQEEQIQEEPKKEIIADIFIEEPAVEPMATKAIKVGYNTESDILIIHYDGNESTLGEEQDSGLVYHKTKHDHAPHAVAVRDYMKKWHDRAPFVVEKTAVFLDIDEHSINKAFEAVKSYQDPDFEKIITREKVWVGRDYYWK